MNFFKARMVARHRKRISELEKEIQKHESDLKDMPNKFAIRKTALKEAIRERRLWIQYLERQNRRAEL